MDFGKPHIYLLERTMNALTPLSSCLFNELLLAVDGGFTLEDSTPTAGTTGTPTTFFAFGMLFLPP